MRLLLINPRFPESRGGPDSAMSAITPLLEDERKQAEVAYARLLYKMYAVTDMMEVNSKSVSGDE
jgi:hypothetical protein